VDRAAWQPPPASEKKSAARPGPALRKTKSRRIVLQPKSSFAGLEANSDAWFGEFSRGRWSPFKTHPIVRLTENGADWGVAPGPGDEVGYAMDPYLGDDCFACAIATCVQVDVEQVPDLKLNARLKRGEDYAEVNRSSWERIARWAEGRGWQLTPHEQVPADRERWIGLVVSHSRKSVVLDSSGRLITHDDDKGFNNHCLNMSYDRMIFDPGCSFTPPSDMRLMGYSPGQISYGISFDDPKE
jgi:hypothetical protein